MAGFDDNPEFCDIRNMKIIPINSAKIMYGADVGGAGINGIGLITFDNLEAGSQWELNPVLEDNDRGGQTIVAFEFKGTFIVLQNNYQDMRPALSNMTHYQPSDFDLFLKAISEQANGDMMWITCDEPTVAVNDWHLTWAITQKDLSPLLTINITGIMSIDMIDAASIPFFTQYWNLGYVVHTIN
jgi:hypothetical protein